MTEEEVQIYKWLDRIMDEIRFIKWAGLLIFALSGFFGAAIALAWVAQ